MGLRFDTVAEAPDVGVGAGRSSAPPTINGTTPLPTSILPPMSAADWFVLGKSYEGWQPGQMAEALGIPVGLVRARLGSEDFQAARIQLEQRVAGRITEGDLGIGVLAKKESIGAMQRLVALSQVAANEETRRKASIDVLAFAGIVPIKKIEMVRPETLVDQMTPGEMRVFAATGKWPMRFREQLARLAVKSAAQRQLTEKVDAAATQLAQGWETAFTAPSPVHGMVEDVVEVEGAGR